MTKHDKGLFQEDSEKVMKKGRKQGFIGGFKQGIKDTLEGSDDPFIQKLLKKLNI
ncbi:hypothetical protein ACOAKC_00690 [Hathewaya histolytica]|uniref:hypothetical protein n=1 Tax=Hathewaya histolytica TaxID=1498 RepID=UPI003B66C450